MEIVYQEKEMALLHLIGKAAAKTGTEAHAIGGFVRDKLLGRPSKDIDIVCDGDGIQLAKAVGQQFSPSPEVHIFKNFGTAQIKWKEYEIEFVGARKESYRYDSRKPIVQPGTLEDDQKRRDFTINAMSVSLNPKTFRSEERRVGRESIRASWS